MDQIEIIVHRPAGTRAQEQLARSYQDQAGLTKELLDQLENPLISLPVPDSPPELAFQVILLLLPEDTVRFRVITPPASPGAKEEIVRPWTWLVRAEEPWPHMPAELSPNHSLREMQLATHGCQPPHSRGPVFLSGGEQLLYVGENWNKFQLTELSGEPDKKFPCITFDPTLLPASGK